MKIKYLGLLFGIIFSIYGCMGEDTQAPLTSSSNTTTSSEAVTVSYNANWYRLYGSSAGRKLVLDKNIFTNQDHSFLGWSCVYSSDKADYANEAEVTFF